MNVRKGRRLTGQQRLPARRRGRRRDRPSFARRNSVASVDSIEKIDFIDRLNRENRLNRPTFSTQSTQSTQSRKKRRRAKRGGKNAQKGAATFSRPTARTPGHRAIRMFASYGGRCVLSRHFCSRLSRHFCSRLSRHFSPSRLSRLSRLSSLFLSILLSSSSRSEKFRPLSDLCNLVISSHSYDNKRNYLKFTFSHAILNSGGLPH